MLSEYEGIGVSLEAHIPDGIKFGKVNINSEKDLEEYLNIIYSDRKFNQWNLDKSKIKQALLNKKYPLSFKEILNEILWQYFNREEIHIIVYKSPYIYHLKKARQLWKEAKILYIKRDPRAIYNSQSKTTDTFNQTMAKNPVKFSLYYKAVESMIQKYKSRSWFNEVKYEDLIRNSDETMKHVLKFLNVADQKMTKPTDYYKQIEKEQKHLHKNLMSAPIIERINAWKKELDEKELWIIQSLCKKEILENGYEIETVHINTISKILASFSYWIRYIFQIYGKYTLARLWWENRQI